MKLSRLQCPSLGLLASVFVFGWLVRSAAAQSDAPKIVGTWKLNLAKSTFTSGPPLKSRTLKWGWDGATLTHQADTVDAKGVAGVARFSAKFDGKDYPVFEGGEKAPARFVRMRMIDAYTIEAINRKDGKDMTTYRHTVSKDGKTDTITQTGTTTEGGKGKDVLVYDRQ